MSPTSSNPSIPVTAPVRPVPLRAFVLLAATAFASTVNLRICDSLLPQIARDFSASVGQAAAIVTGFAVGYGLLQLLFGPVGDRFGKYLVIALASIATGVATACAAASLTLDSLFWARFVAGACAAAPIPLAFAWMGDVVPFERRQPVLARFLTAQISGIVLGQALGGVVGDLYGWRTMFIMVGLIHVLAGAAMLAELWLNPATQPAPASAHLSLRTIAGGLGVLMRRPWVRIILASVFVEGFAFYGAFAYIGSDLQLRFGLGAGLAGLIIASFGAGAIVYSWTARTLLGWLGEHGLALSGGALLVVSYVALAVVPFATLVAPIMVGLGLGFFMIHNTLQTNATQMAPEARGQGVSMFAFALFLSQSLGVALAAPIIDRWGAPPVYVTAALLLGGIALWFRASLRHRPIA